MPGASARARPLHWYAEPSDVERTRRLTDRALALYYRIAQASIHSEGVLRGNPSKVVTGIRRGQDAHHDGKGKRDAEALDALHWEGLIEIEPDCIRVPAVASSVKTKTAKPRRNRQRTDSELPRGGGQPVDSKGAGLPLQLPSQDNVTFPVNGSGSGRLPEDEFGKLYREYNAFEASGHHLLPDWRKHRRGVQGKQPVPQLWKGWKALSGYNPTKESWALPSMPEDRSDPLAGGTEMQRLENALRPPKKTRYRGMKG